MATATMPDARRAGIQNPNETAIFVKAGMWVSLSNAFNSGQVMPSIQNHIRRVLRMKLTLLTLLLVLSAAASAADVSLAWNYAGTNHDGFRLRYKMQGDSVYSPPITIGPAARDYTHVNAPMGTLLYKLTAFHVGGESAAAFVWTVIESEPPGPPAAPQSTTVTVTFTNP